MARYWIALVVLVLVVGSLVVGYSNVNSISNVSDPSHQSRVQQLSSQITVANTETTSEEQTQESISGSNGLSSLRWPGADKYGILGLAALHPEAASQQGLLIALQQYPNSVVLNTALIQLCMQKRDAHCDIPPSPQFVKFAETSRVLSGMMAKMYANQGLFELAQDWLYRSASIAGSDPYNMSVATELEESFSSQEALSINYAIGLSGMSYEPLTRTNYEHELCFQELSLVYLVDACNAALAASAANESIIGRYEYEAFQLKVQSNRGDITADQHRVRSKEISKEYNEVYWDPMFEAPQAEDVQNCLFASMLASTDLFELTESEQETFFKSLKEVEDPWQARNYLYELVIDRMSLVC